MDDDFGFLSLRENQLREVKDWEIGETYRVELVVEMTGKNKPIFSNKKGIVGNFQIIKAKQVTKED